MNFPVQGHVLFVCDRAVSDPVVATVSGQLGQALVRVRNAEEALARAGVTDFALILVGYAGQPQQLLDTLRDLHAHPRARHTPLVALGLPALPPFPIELAYQAGAIDVLHEPLLPAVLTAKARFFIDAFRNAGERRQAEAALVETRARLEATIAAAELAVWSWDVPADRVYADPALARLFGVSQADAGGGPLAAYLAALHADDIAAVRVILADAMARGGTYDASYRVRGQDGVWRWVIARGDIELDGAGQPSWVRGVVIDVSRQKDAEAALEASQERYRTLFNSLDEGVCVIEVLFDGAGQACDYRFLEINPAFVAQTGFAGAAGKSILSLVPNLERHWFDIYGHVVQSGQPVRFVNEARALDSWYDVYATRLGPAGSHQLAVVFTDISARRRADDELRRLADDLAEADRLKSEFLATLAHELRNPLAPIRSGLQFMRRMPPDAAALGRVRDIVDRQLDHLVHLVDDLLDVARITRGQVELKREWIDLNAVLQAAVEISTPLIEAARHQLDLRLLPEPVTLYGDATRLTQVISNLLNNAAKYTPRGGALVLAAERDGEHVLIAVSDNGVGIPADSLEAVFRMFTQVGSSTHRQGGLGIGLSLVRSLVELHGGSIRAASGGAGNGSVFTARLPIAPADAPQRVAAAPAAPALVAAAGLRVLVVDDNRDAAETLAALLNLMGHVAPVANDGHQALRMLPGLLPHAVFLDIGMPGLSGYEVAAEIRKDPQYDGVTLVALTGWGGAEDRERSAGAGFDLHLTKPASAAAIEAVLAR